jgi:hypothetical protein
MQYLLALHRQNNYSKTPQCYLIRALPILFHFPFLKGKICVFIHIRFHYYFRDIERDGYMEMLFVYHICNLVTVLAGRWKIGNINGPTSKNLLS